MTRLHLIAAVAFIGSAGAYAACSKSNPEPEKSSSAEGASAPAPVAPGPAEKGSAGVTAAAVTGDEVAWDAPSAWTSVPNANTMRKATYKIPKAPGDDGDTELTVSAAGGGVEPNIRRWAGQFGNAEPKTEMRTVHGLKVTVVEIKGTYAASGGMMGGPSTPKDKYMLLGAVVDGADRQHFFKMTGPEKTVTAAKKDFDALVASLHAK
jgi:hypothetical protein